MIELLILYKLNFQILTMYGVSKEIRKTFSTLTTPSYGTIKPALIRLEDAGYVKTQKTISTGGRPSTYYSITSDGKKELKELILEAPQENPIQFLTTARIKLICADLLDNNEKIILFKNLEYKSKSILIDSENLVKNVELSFYPKMVFNNINSEYKNFISLLEELIHACNSK